MAASLQALRFFRHALASHRPFQGLHIRQTSSKYGSTSSELIAMLYQSARTVGCCLILRKLHTQQLDFTLSSAFLGPAY